MSRLLTLCFTALVTTAVAAQFGPQNTAFRSDIDYPYRFSLGDVDGDGDLDALFALNNDIQVFKNDGNGNMAPAQYLVTTQLMGGSSLLLTTDLDNDGTLDLVANQQWFPGLGDGNFGAAMPLLASGSFAFADDLNGDGLMDFVERANGNVRVRLNNGDGTLSMGQVLGPNGTITSMYAAYADLDGDGVKDLLIGGENPQIGWYAGLGGGTFGAMQTISGLYPVKQVFTLDMDMDGDMDIIAVNNASPVNRWFSNDGTGSFTLESPISGEAFAFTVADLNGDGLFDISANTGTQCHVRWRMNNGDGTFNTIVIEDLPNAYSLQGTSYAVGDIDGDGVVDVAFANGQGLAGWFRNLGDATFSPRHTMGHCMGGANSLAVVDVDLDGDLDLVATSSRGKQITWYSNDGNGQYGPQQLIAEHLEGLGGLLSADLNGDGFPDLTTSHASVPVIRKNNGGSSWTAYTLPGEGVVRALADVDGDGDMDLIGVGEWFRNEGGFNFSAVPSVALEATGRVKVGDMNGDGVVDVIIGSNNSITAAINDGAGNFTSMISSGNAAQFDLADIEGDGDLDVIGSAGNLQIDAHLNDGNGNFTLQPLFTGPNGFMPTIIARDINTDGHVDVVYSRSEGYTHVTYFNLNNGDGTLGGASIADPSAEATSALVLADVNGDAVPDLVNARFHSLAWQENHFYNSYRVRGSVFVDYDVNAMHNGNEPKVPYQLVTTDATNILVWTNSDGNYDHPGTEGTVNIWSTVPQYYQVTNDPDTITVELTSGSPIAENVDFGLAPSNTGEHLIVSVGSSGFFRCDAHVMSWIDLRNNGTSVPQNISFAVYVDPDLSVTAFPPPTSVSGEYMYWELDSLNWFQQFQIALSVDVGPVGSSAELSLSITGDGMTGVSRVLNTGEVTCAYDPNDKLVTPLGYGIHGAIPIDTEWLTYTVRFQNTGNDTAFTVVIRDTLDAYLDRHSMEVLTASHALTAIQVDGGNVATFRFDQIMLPDSNMNEPLSNGMVIFRIKPNAGLPHLTEITNSAGIYFDLNPAIITNTTLNTLVDCGLHEAAITLGDGVLTASEGDIHQWFLNDVAIPNATAPEIELAAVGEYTVEVTSIYGCSTVSAPYVHLVTGQSSLNKHPIRVFPNPMHDQLIVQTGDHTITRMELHDMSGRIVRTWNVTSDEEMLEGDGIMAGTYLLRMMNGGELIDVVRVVVL